MVATNKKQISKKTAKGVGVKRNTSTGQLVGKKSRVASGVINERYEMRISSHSRIRWERAKVISGFSTLKDYLTHLADQDAERVIEKHEKMTLSNDVFDRFVNACDKASQPNFALLAAAKSAKEQGF